MGPIASLATYDEIAETLTGVCGSSSETRRLSGALMAFSPAFFGPTPPVLKGDKVILRAPGSYARTIRESGKLRGASRRPSIEIIPGSRAWVGEPPERTGRSRALAGLAAPCSAINRGDRGNFAQGFRHVGLLDLRDMARGPAYGWALV